MKKIIIIEPNKTLSQHITFNAAILDALANHDINLYVSKSALFFYKKNDNVKINTIPVINGDSRKFIAKGILELTILILYLIKTGKSFKFLILSISPNVLFFFEIFCTLFGYKNVICLIHGELEGLIEKDKASITSYGYWIKKWLWIRGFTGVIAPVFLSEYIYRNLLNYRFIYDDYFKKFFVIEHPIPRLSSFAINKINALTIVFIGTRSSRKGYDSFISIFENIEKTVNIEFYSLGSGKLINHTQGMIKSIDSSEYLNLLTGFDIAIFPAANSYTLTVSGAINDAIAAGLLIFAVDSSMARHYQKYLGSENIEIFSNTGEISLRINNLNKDLIRGSRDIRLKNLNNSLLGFELNKKVICNLFA